MNIIEINNITEIKENPWYGYVSEPSVTTALNHFIDKFGYHPENIYVKKSKTTGRCSIYIPVDDDNNSDQ